MQEKTLHERKIDGLNTWKEIDNGTRNGANTNQCCAS
jgi:hypothetical protein